MSNSRLGKVRWLLGFGMLMLCLNVGISFLFTTEAHAENVDPVLIQQIQLYLTELGYPVGTIDGVLGKNTRMAISNFQYHHNLPVDGEISIELLEFLRRLKSEQETELSKMSANQIYINALQFETQGELENASVYYRYLMKTYPDTDVGVKAAERFSRLSLSLSLQLTPQPTSQPAPQSAPQPISQPTPQSTSQPISQPIPQPIPQPTSEVPSDSSLMSRFHGMDRTTKIVLGVGAGVVGLGVIAFALNDDGGNGSSDGNNSPDTEDPGLKLGIWSVNADYLCNGRDIMLMTWDIRDGNTFTCLDCIDYGTWNVNGKQITISSYTGFRVQYTGTITSSGDIINGTFVDIENETGCWNATYRYH